MKRILIANRGECALRIQRTLSKMGYLCVMIYSEEDRQSKHVAVGDFVYNLGSGPSAQTYLNQDRILEIAKKANCFAIHPGYGFLAENPAFAKKCRERELCWIGPSPEMIELFGDKIAARKAMKERGVPILPGTMEPIETIQELKEIVSSLHGPALLKAAGGGGGKGMRIIRDPENLEEQFTQCSAEAKKAFGDPRVFVEKYIESGRHIEIQVLGDQHGNACHFGARECSVQRRHQKVLEESPVGNVDRTHLENLIQTVVQATSDLCYDSLGTYEFLLSPEGDFFFLETNTRLQVEHSVTELTYGVDLVEQQVRSALGDRLDESLRGLIPKGWAMEARIYAEDPEHNFAPSPGKIDFLMTPTDEHVRIDDYLESSGTVPMFFDPMIAKATAWGWNREGVNLKLKKYLSRYLFGGITTNIPFHLWLLEQVDFLENRMDTGFLDRNMEDVKSALIELSRKWRMVSTGLTYLLNDPHPIYEKIGLNAIVDDEPTSYGLTHFKSLSGELGIDIQIENHQVLRIEILSSTQNSFHALVDQTPVEGVFERLKNGIQLGVYGRVHQIEIHTPGTIPLRFLKPKPKDLDGDVLSPIQGTITRVLIDCGNPVREGELLLVVEAMKMENEIRAPINGVIDWIGKELGAAVSSGELLVRIQEEDPESS